MYARLFVSVVSCNLHGACGGKVAVQYLRAQTLTRCNLHGACGGKAQHGRWALLPLRCNLHGACGGKGADGFQKNRRRRCNLHGACGGKVTEYNTLTGLELSCNLHGACGGKAQARLSPGAHSVAICTGRVEAKCAVCAHTDALPGCNLHGACGGKGGVAQMVLIARLLQSARGVWRQSVGAAALSRMPPLQSARGVWRQRNQERMVLPCIRRLQSARGVWRQSSKVVVSLIVQPCCNLHGACGGKVKRSQERGGKLHVAICTGPAEKPNGIIPRKNPRKFMQTYCIFIHFDV